VFDLGTPTATSEDSSYPVENAFDLRPYKYFKPTAAGTVRLRVDAGSAVSVDSLALMGHNLKTASASVSVEGSATGAWGGEEVTVLTSFNPSSDKALYKKITSASYRYWQVTITTASVIPFIAVLVLGVRLTFERFIKGEFNPRPEGMRSMSNFNETGGQLLGRVNKARGLKFTLSFQYLTSSWVDNTFLPAWDNYISTGNPLFLIWDPGNHPDEVYFVWIPDRYELAVPYIASRRNLSLAFEGVVE